MKTIQHLRTVINATVLGLALCAIALAQANLAPADIAWIVRTWTRTFETPQGLFDRTLVVERRESGVVAELKDWGNFHFEPTTDVTKSDEGIAFRLAASYSGQAFRAVVTLAIRSDGTVKATFDANEGQTVLSGQGVVRR